MERQMQYDNDSRYYRRRYNGWRCNGWRYKGWRYNGRHRGIRPNHVVKRTSKLGASGYHGCTLYYWHSQYLVTRTTRKTLRRAVAATKWRDALRRVRWTWEHGHDGAWPSRSPENMCA